MRKKSVYMWSLVAALMMTACSDQNELVESGNTSSLEFAVDFGQITGTRAPQSSAIPTTSWSKSINQVQFFLYGTDNVVKYSAVVDPTTSSDSPKKFVYTDVPTGTYTLVAVANVDAANDEISTAISGTATTWGGYNVRSKAVSDLTIGYKSTSFPAFATPAGCTAFAAPSEVFMAYATNVVIRSGEQTTLSSALKLTREISLLRARLNVDDTASGVNNSTNVAGGVDWTNDVSILVYRLPNSMGIANGTAGGTSTSSTATNIIVDTRMWNTANPATGYSPLTILSGQFTKWQDLVVFPNNGGRGSALTADDDSKASVDNQYFIVVTARGKAGHVLGNGNQLDSDERIYWDGLIQHAFFPNYIREVNLTLKSGGKNGSLPTVPTEQGELIITVSDPEPWKSILETGMEL